MDKKIKVLWKETPKKGSIEVVYGNLSSIKISKGNGTAKSDIFEFTGVEGTLTLSISNVKVSPGAFATIVRVLSDKNPFSFFLRDALHPDNPIWIPEYGVAVTTCQDKRPYDKIGQDIKNKKALSDFARFASEPEESFESASKKNRDQYCPTWLGISRDIRIFRFGYQESVGYFGRIVPCYHSFRNEKLQNSDILFVIGQGASCRTDIKRHLEDGYMPILRAVQKEQSMNYRITAFASLETQPLTEEAVKGSHYLAAYANSGGNMLKEEDRKAIKKLLDREMHHREEEVVLLTRVEAVNTGKVPCYAWFKTPYTHKTRFNGKGFTLIDKEVIAVTRLNGEPSHDEEISVLVQPGERVVLEMLVPHSPISEKRAMELQKLNFDHHLQYTRRYWEGKIKTAAGFRLPEKPIDESVKAGLLHCDLVAYGKEPDGPVAATIGWYSPIGTESSPIIQYFDSAGWHRLAERSIQFFFERQYKNGFIQNFARYESETGPLLWTAGEHYRYTRDKKWLKKVMPNIKRAVDYILQWRERNKKEEYREKGYYGMVDGKVADPDDYYHSFFLNAGSYIGLKRISEVTEDIEPEYSKRLKREVEEYRRDIRYGFYYSQARAPVVPCGDGSWGPLMPPWVEYNGGITLYADGGRWFSHEAFASRSSLTGPIWLVISEVLSPEEIGTTFMLKTNQFPVTLDNACLSQPYYSRHDLAHIKRREVESFLRCYYNQLTGLMDRETYTFWEHYSGHSQHKTHEEAWFLMQTRWMLYMEKDSSINIFPAVPRRWFEDGKRIEVKNASSYFGRVSFASVSELSDKRTITASFESLSKRKPEKIRIRIPHPDGKKPKKVEGGSYEPHSETVEVAGFKGRCSIRLYF